MEEENVKSRETPEDTGCFIVLYDPSGVLRSQASGLLVVPIVFKSRMRGKAFSF